MSSLYPQSLHDTFATLLPCLAPAPLTNATIPHQDVDTARVEREQLLVVARVAALGDEVGTLPRSDGANGCGLSSHPNSSTVGNGLGRCRRVHGHIGP